MQVNVLARFRIFYNNTIYPELMRLERLRLRLLRLLLISAFVLVGVIIFEFYLDILLVTLLLSVPMVLYVIYLGYRIRKFIFTFKPQVMRLVLEFISNEPNIGDLSYEAKGTIEKGRFLKSQIFVTPAPIYEAEDFIKGKVGEMDFELCEVNVREVSIVRNRTNYVFKGVFLHATFTEETRGRIIIWPREFRQYLTRSLKAFVRKGGENVDHEVMNEQFRELFLTYATGDTHVISILSEPMQEAIVEYRLATGKEIYLSFIGKEIYVAITEPKDILEPFIFKSNVSFELVREFFEDVNLLLSIVEDFDQTH